MMSNPVPARPAGRRRGRLRAGLMAAIAGCCTAAMVTVGGPAHAASYVIIPGWHPPWPVCLECGPGTMVYAYGAYVYPAGDAEPGQQFQIVLTGTVQGQPAAGGTLYLSDNLVVHGATVTIGGSPLTPTPRPFILNSAGQLTVTYQVADVSPGPLGIDTITAADTASGTGAVTISYNYDRPTSYELTPLPLAPPGSLRVGQTVTAQLTALDQEGYAVAGAAVADWGGDDTCGTWYPWWPFPWPPRGSYLNDASDPSDAYTDSAGQIDYTFTLTSLTGAASVLNVEGLFPATSPVTTYYTPEG
jgi:hypothetical protein